MTTDAEAQARPSLAEVLAKHRAVVCVGTGGVGKTTLAAAIALAGAMQGRRAMVLTIDPARQLARALGLQGLRWGGEAVDLSPLETLGMPAPAGELHAGMLDQKAAWDDFITRHAPSEEVRDSILGNRFYQQLSTVMAGSTEYMAIEELCRLDESHRYDLIVVDTPPAGYAVDFLRAPDRLEHLLDPEVMKWFSRRYVTLGRGAFRAVSASVRYAVRQLERAAGTRSLREISAFFVAFDALFGDIAGRMVRARAILRSPETAFVLVVGPGERVLAQGDALMDSINGFEVPLRAVVANRVHPLTDAERARPSLSERLYTELASTGTDAQVLSWLRASWQEAILTDQTEQERLRRFAEAVPKTAAWAEVAELAHDAHSLLDLAQVAMRMGALGAPSDESSQPLSPPSSSPTTETQYPADLYAALHTGTEGDVDFYRAVCSGADRVLELGCGHGRMLAALADLVGDLHGVDASAEALALARQRLPASVQLHQSDMQSFDVGKDFDRVLIPFNGLYCLPDLDAVRRCFVQVEKALAADGILVFDGYAGDPIHEDDSLEEGFDEEEEIAMVKARGKRWRVFERSEYDRNAQRFTVHYRYLAEDDGEEVRATIHHRFLRLEETLAALHDAGLEALVVHGDFDQSVYDEDSERMIVTARRRPTETRA